MDFDQWLRANTPELVSADEAAGRDLAQAAWIAATNFERERCANLCEEIARQKTPSGAGYGEEHG